MSTDYQCRSCEIEAKKYCDECGGYGSESEEEEEEEEVNVSNENIKEVIGKWLSDPKNNWNDITDFLIDDLGIEVVDEDEDVAKKKEEDGFGTAYHDGSGFADCDPKGSGNRKCNEYEDESVWCSECIYLKNNRY